MKIAIIDNYDSFTYNLAHLVRSLGAEVSVYDAGGRLLGSGVAQGSLASVRTSLHAGSMAVVKIGGKAVKVVMR